MRFYILTRNALGKVRVVEIDKPILNCPNTGFGPYDFYPTPAYLHQMEISEEKLPSWEELQEFDYEEILSLLDKIVSLRKKNNYTRRPTLH